MTSVVAFLVGDLGFTVPLGTAREVIRVRRGETEGESTVLDRWLFPLPEAPPAVLGLVAHRSLLVPVVDVAALYGIATPQRLPRSHLQPCSPHLQPRSPFPHRQGRFRADEHLLTLRVETPERRVVALLVDRVIGVRRPGDPKTFPYFPFDEARVATLVGALAPLELV